MQLLKTMNATTEDQLSQCSLFWCRFEPQTAVRRSILATNASGVTCEAVPKFQADEGTLLKRLVLKGSDVHKPAAARLSSANDPLFNGDPFGIYRTVQFQTNLWEMLLSYREVCFYHVCTEEEIQTLLMRPDCIRCN